jgi:hypothetical protein
MAGIYSLLLLLLLLLFLCLIDEYSSTVANNA